MKAVAPSPLDQFAGLITKYAQQYDVPEAWIRATIMTESRGDPKAWRAEPRKGPGVGSRGLMQIMPKTARDLGFTGDLDELYEPEKNINFGTKLLGQLREAHGDAFDRVYSAYNSGDPDAFRLDTAVAQHTSNALDNLKVFGGADKPAPPPVESFEQVRRQLPSDISSDDYNKIRLQFFNTKIRPRVREGYSVEATYKDFLERTEQPLPVRARQMGARLGDLTSDLLMQGVELSALMTIMGPIAGGASRALFGISKAADISSKIMRGGMAFAAYETLEAQEGDRVAAAIRGAAIGSLWEAGIGAVLGFSEKGANTIAKEAMNEKLPGPSVLTETALNKEAAAAARAASRTMSPEERWFRAFGSARGKPLGPTDVVLSPASGVIGEGRVVTEPLVAEVELLPRPAPKEFGPQLEGIPERPLLAETAESRVTRRELPTRIGGKFRRIWEAPGMIADALVSTVKTARLQGYLMGPMVETPTTKGLRIVLMDAEGKPTLLNVARGTESAIIGQVEETLAKGGSLDSVMYHPASRARAAEFMRYFAEKAEDAEDTLRLRVIKGRAGEVAKQLNRMGLQGTVVDDATVRVGPYSGWKAAQMARAAEKASQAKAGGIGGLDLSKAISDDIAKKAFRVGEIRALIHGMNGGNRSLYAELHHLQGEIGQATGILNRADIGKLGLRYYERLANGDPADFGKMIERYKGPRGPIGEKPPVGNQDPTPGILRGYRKSSSEPPVPEGMVRFYRGEPMEGSGGQWFTSDREQAEFYLYQAAASGRPGKLTYVDVDPLTARQARLSPEVQLHSTRPDIEAFLPSEFASQAKTIRTMRLPPVSETVTWDADPAAASPEGEGVLRVRPSGKAKILKATEAEYGGAGGQAVHPVEGPMRILASDTALDRGTLYHEGVHDGFSHAGLDDLVPVLAKGHERTADGIVKGLQATWPDSYIHPEIGHEQLMNEAFTHAAEAIRFNDQTTLKVLGDWDTSVSHVRQFVHDTAAKALEASMASDTAPVRAFQRRMNDLIRRTTPFRTTALQNAEKFGYRSWYSPRMGQWVMQDGEGRQFLLSDYAAVADRLEAADPSSHFPDVMHKAYMKGMRGPIVPPGMEPVDGPVTLEVDSVPLGWQGIRSWFQPALDHFASVQKRLSQYGITEEQVPYYRAAKALDDQAHVGFPLRDELDQKLRATLDGVPKQRRSDYGEILSLPESDWDAAARELGLGPDDMANIRLVQEWDREKGGVSLIDTLTSMRKVREAGGDIQRALGDEKNAVTRAIENGALGYSDLHVGHVGQWTLNRTIGEKFLDEPIKAFEKVLETRTASGNRLLEPVMWASRNYIDALRMVPDQSQQVLESWVRSMQSAAGKYASRINAMLPEGMKLPENFHTPPRELMAKYMLLQYTAGLGGRPAVMVRDTFNAMKALAVMGPSAFAEGLSLALTSAGRDEVRAAGAMLKGRNVSEFFGDISGNIPASGRVSDFAVKFADKLLSPTRIGDNIGRTIVYLGEQRRALREIARYRLGQIGEQELMNNTGMWFQDMAPKSRLLAIAADKGLTTEEAAQKFGQAMVDALQFPMRSGTQAAVLRTGLGRVFGQYGTWPTNELEFWRKLASRAFDNPKKGMPALGAWMAINYGAFKGAEALGIDAAKWLFFSPVGYTGSPNLEMVQNIMAAPEESPRGMEARRALHDTYLNFVPAGVQIQNLMRAIEDGDTSIPRLLGFKPLKDQPARELDDWLALELGFTRR